MVQLLLNQLQGSLQISLTICVDLPVLRGVRLKGFRGLGALGFIGFRAAAAMICHGLRVEGLQHFHVSKYSGQGRLMLCVGWSSGSVGV